MLPPYSRRFRVAVAASVCAILVPATSPPARGQVGSSPPAYALQNARIVTMAGESIASGTLVMRDGRIADVGPDVPAPADAIVVDATGWTLYPGFIDAQSHVGMPRPDSQDESAQQTRERGEATRHVDPGADALGRYEADPRALASARRAGLTTAAIAPRRGLLPGHGAIITLRDGDVARSVLRDRWGQHVRFEPFDRRTGRYPGTLMGMMAAVRQHFADAAWYEQAWAAYRRSPDRADRPEHDPALAALGAAVSGDQPIVFTAWTENEIHRALRLAEDVGLTATQVLVGGDVEAWRIANRLVETAHGVLLSLDLRPRREATGFGASRAGPITKPDPADVADAEANAARLHAAGVRFAFTSAHLPDLADLLPNLRKAVRAGLPRDAALEALTVTPAALLGLGDALGSIEVGKAAHVVAVEGDLFEDDGRVAASWIDGEFYDLAAANRHGPHRRGARRDRDDHPASERTADADSRTLLERRAPAGPLWPDATTTVIRHGTILTVADGRIAPGTIVIQDGRIQAVGHDDAVNVPDGARVIDATGLYVMPGIVDAHSHMAITGGGNESSEAVTPEVRIDDVINHRDPAIFRALAGGATTVNVLHGSANVVGGQNAVLKLRWGKPAAELFFEGAPRGVKFALGENPKRSNRPTPRDGQRRYPATRMGVEHLLRTSFEDARRYRSAHAGHAAARARGEDPPPPRRDLRLEALGDILDGRILVHAHSYRSDEILMLLRVAEDFGFRIASLQHVLEGYKVADEIASHGAGASTFADNWGYKMEALDAIPYNMALMTERGVSVSINSDSDERVRRLNVEAAKAVKYGRVSEQDALRMITLGAAEHIGVADRVGSIEVGKDADLAIFTAHPFEADAHVQYTLVDGQVFFDRARVETTGDALTRLTEEAAADDTSTTDAADTPATRFVRWTPPTEPTGPGGRLRPASGYGDITSPRIAEGGSVVAIVGGRVLTMAGTSTSPLEPATVVIRDGRIAAVGADIDIPSGARVIQAEGLTVTPGLINAGTTVGLSEIGAVSATQDVSEIDEVNSSVKASVAVHPHSEMLPITRANGVTTTLTAPQGGLIAGQAALVDLAGWTPPEIVARSPVSMHLAFPERTGETGANGDRDDRVERQRRTLRRWMRRAQAYAGALASGLPSRPDEDAKLAALVPVVRGELPVVVEASSAEGIRAALAFVDEFGLEAILSSTRDVWKVVDEIANARVPVLLGPIERVPPAAAPYDSIYAAARLLHESGVPFAFLTGGAANARNLPYHAALAVAFGLPRAAAWHALTLGAAEILGIDDLYGSLEPGKIANVVVSHGDLLDVPTEVRHVFIRGHEVDLTTRHTRLYEQFRGRPTTSATSGSSAGEAGRP